MPPKSKSSLTFDDDYAVFLDHLKEQIRFAQVQAAQALTQELRFCRKKDRMIQLNFYFLDVIYRSF